MRGFARKLEQFNHGTPLEYRRGMTIYLVFSSDSRYLRTFGNAVEAFTFVDDSRKRFLAENPKHTAPMMQDTWNMADGTMMYGYRAIGPRGGILGGMHVLAVEVE